MRSALALVLLSTVLSSCATTDDPDHLRGPHGDYRRSGGRAFTSENSPAAGLALPPSNWWHDSALAPQLSLSAEQFAKLDALVADEENVERLRSDSVAATRDFRSSLDTMAPLTGETTRASDDPLSGATRRMQAVRAELLEHEARLLVAERSILTTPQWKMLQDELQQQRASRTDGGRGMRGGGRGGMGGGRSGRRGGMGGWQ